MARGHKTPDWLKGYKAPSKGAANPFMPDELTNKAPPPGKGQPPRTPTIAEANAAAGSVKPDPSLQVQNEWQGMRQDAIDTYKGKSLGYNPYKASAGPQMGGMNYNPYRSAATNQAQSQAAGGLASQQSQLQQAGGLSGSDRMKMFSDFNRSKIMGTLGASQQADQMQSQNQLDVGRFNAGRSFDVNARNVAQQNEANQFGAMANQRRDFNLYNDALGQRNLDRQLEASRIIGQAQMGSNYNPGLFDKLLDPVFRGFDTIGGMF